MVPAIVLVTFDSTHSFLDKRHGKFISSTRLQEEYKVLKLHDVAPLVRMAARYMINI